MSFGDKNFEYETIFDNNIVFEQLQVLNGQTKYCQIFMSGSLGLLLSDEEEVTIKIQIPDELVAPVKRGDVVGSVELYIDEDLYTKYDVIAADNVKAINYPYFFNIVLDQWLGYREKIKEESNY